MAYYDALVTAWNMSSASPGALPTGVAGTSLFGLSTTNKITTINAWTVTGTIPASTTFTGSDLANCINYAEYKALTGTLNGVPVQQAVMQLCAIQGGLKGGSANTTLLPVGLILDAFPNHSGPTIANLTALANALVEPWWATSVAQGGGGLGGPVTITDVDAAGLS